MLIPDPAVRSVSGETPVDRHTGLVSEAEMDMTWPDPTGHRAPGFF